MVIWACYKVRHRCSPWLLVPAAVLAGVLSGCSSLPSSGPTADQIVHDQAKSNSIGFRIIDIDAASPVPEPPSGLAQTLSSLTKPGGADRLGAGDVLMITIFEVGTTLFAGQTSARAASAGLTPPSADGEALPPATVEDDGTVTLPYVGRLMVADHTLSEVQAMIAEGLKGKSQTPQAMVAVRENVSGTVVVMGEVKKPGRIPLSRAHDRVLDAVAGGGGLNYPLQDTVVRLTRDGRSASLRLDHLSAASADNIVMLPQDRIELLYRPLTYTIFGATKVSETPFQSPTVNLAEAIARAGGPLDQQADPSAVFVFRYSEVDMDGAPVAGARPIAYRLDLNKAESYFLAQIFQIHPHDVLYIANSRSNQPTKLIQVLNLFFQPAYTAKVVSQ